MPGAGASVRRAPTSRWTARRTSRSTRTTRANAPICDLKLAPRNGAGLVEFAADFSVVLPVDAETGERPLHRRAAEPRPPPRRRHDELRAARCTRGAAGASGRRVPVRPRLHGRLHRLAMGRLPEPGADGPRRAFGHGGRQADRRGDDSRDPTERARDDAPPRRPHPPTAPGRARGAARRAPPRARLGGRRGHADTALALALRARDPGGRRGAVGRARVARGRLRAGAHLSARLRDRPGARGGARPPRRARRGGVPAHAFAHQSMRQRAPQPSSSTASRRRAACSGIS